MNRIVFNATLAIGLAAVAWVGWGFVGGSWLALAITVVIAAVYLLGAWELHQFRGATATLAAALADVPQSPPSIAEWLKRLSPSLQNAVRSRIEGERVGLPGPALTPYLVGLLVMLGMLGTFLGMVLTFKGAVFALEGSTDLQAIRSALAAPIKGLGLSFGTSVAGVAASAMLGLMSAISRRERLEAARLLDTRIATVFRPFSLVHQRQETFKALQQQAHALPDVAAKLQAMMERMEQRSQQLDAQLLGQQAQFHREASVAYTGLADAVGASLTESLTASARVAGESIKPVVESAMAELAQESKRMHARLGEVAQAQVDGLSAQFSATATRVSDAWHGALQSQASTSEQLVNRLDEALAGFNTSFAERSAALLGQSDALVQARTEAEARWLQQQGARMDQQAQVWGKALSALRDDEAARGHAAVARLGELQAALAQHLATLGAALEGPLSRLLQTSAEVPQAAADVMVQLRQQMSGLNTRDQLALQERADLMAHIGTLLQTLNQASAEQRAAIDGLVASAAAQLEQAGAQHAQTLQAQAEKSAEAAVQVASSAVELASLGEAFGQGVQLFNAGNDKLVESLQRIEGAIGQSTARSDEQLAYYVAQAREVIDLSISAQQGIVEDLRQLHSRRAALPEESLV